MLFARTEIDLLGYRVSHNLIQPDPERLRPLHDLPLPQKKAELQRVNGMFSYYAKWVPEFSTKIRPLALANLTFSFPLSSEAANAFETLRSQLTSACSLALEKEFRSLLNVMPLSSVLGQRSVKMVHLSLFIFALLLP